MTQECVMTLIQGQISQVKIIVNTYLKFMSWQQLLIVILDLNNKSHK